MEEKIVLDKIIDFIREEGPVMSMGNGGIAGAPPDDPPVRKKKKRYIYAKNTRKHWQQV